nr:hypothetical protein [Micromonospora globispora]
MQIPGDAQALLPGAAQRHLLTGAFGLDRPLLDLFQVRTALPRDEPGDVGRHEPAQQQGGPLDDQLAGPVDGRDRDVAGQEPTEEDEAGQGCGRSAPPPGDDVDRAEDRERGGHPGVCPDVDGQHGGGHRDQGHHRVPPAHRQGRRHDQDQGDVDRSHRTGIRRERGVAEQEDAEGDAAEGVGQIRAHDRTLERPSSGNIPRLR